MLNFDISKLPTPCYVVDEELLEKNLNILQYVQNKTECKILLALKGFAMYATFPKIKQYLAGAAASSYAEARLAKEEFNKEVHTYCVAYEEESFEQLLEFSDHLVFNSVYQWRKFRPIVQQYNKTHNKNIECAIRINPEYSEITVELYNPCAKYSRMGTTINYLTEDDMEGLSGLHFHALCEQNADVLSRVLPIFIDKTSKFFKYLKWVNFGGGHHITAPNYDVELLCSLITNFKTQTKLEVYLEPGEAIAINTGYLVTKVLDVLHNEIDIAILDTSCAAHMPDVLEMPYRPNIIDGDMPNTKAYTYRLAGGTCLSGDIIGDYSFDKPLQINDKLVFLDMAHYTMVKNTTFNGIKLPSIAYRYKNENEATVIKIFGYEDYKMRLS